MEKKSRYNSSYVGNIVTILIFGVIIALSVLVPYYSEMSVYAESVYSFKSVVDPKSVSFSNGTSQDTIKTGLPKTTDILVIETTVSGVDNAEIKTWPDVAKVSWNPKPEETYDPEKKTAQTLTWKGTVSAGSIQYESKSVKIDTNQNVTIKVNVSEVTNTKPSEYSKLESGKFRQKSSSFGLSLDGSGTTIDSTDVGEILDYVYENSNDAVLVDGIRSIMDKGDKLSIEIVAEKLASSAVSDDVKSALKERARQFNDDDDDAEIGNYFDISIYVTDKGKVQNNLKISDPGGTFSFSYKIPSDITKSSSSSTSTSSSDNTKIVKTIYTKRYYNVVRYHSNSAHSVGMDYSTDTTRSFDVSEFSTFATVYYDSTSSSKSTSSSSSKTSSSAGSNNSSLRSPAATGAGAPGTGAAGTGAGAASGGGGATGSKAPKTGDEFNAKLWIYFLVIGIVVALCSFILFQDTKEYYDDKKEESKS